MRQSIKQNLLGAFQNRQPDRPHKDTSRAVYNTPTRPSIVQDPTPSEILQYRYHHGVNLGAVFVLEKWLFSSAFPSNAINAQSSELDAVKAWTKQIGVEGTRTKFEQRWSSCLNDSDWDWLCDTAHCTTIRLPIGYFTLGSSFCKHTPFAAYAEVYANAWASVKTLVGQARTRGVGILLDLHALPGGANKAEHSGTNDGKARLWRNSTNTALAQECLVFLAKEISSSSMDGVVGLQLCNEAEWDAPGLYQWYDSVISAVSAVNSTIPLYISDAWDLGRAITYAKDKNRVHPASARTTNPICVDTHMYFCFADDHKSPEQIIAAIPTQLGPMTGRTGSVTDTGAAQVIIGEWSCTMSGPTWSKIDKANTRGQLTAQFGKAQCKLWQRRTGGSYFWTYKMDWMDGGDWGFVEQIKKGNISAPSHLRLPPAKVEAAITRSVQEKTARGERSCNEHSSYWERTAPNQRFEHWRFQHGWSTGWNDALVFLSFRNAGTPMGPGSKGGHKIGLLELWVKKRIGDSGMLGSSCWEYEAGLRKGVSDFYDCTEI